MLRECMRRKSSQPNSSSRWMGSNTFLVNKMYTIVHIWPLIHWHYRGSRASLAVLKKSPLVWSYSKCTGCAFNGHLPPRLTWSRHLVTFNPDLALCLPTPRHQVRFHSLMLVFQALLRKAAFPRVCRQVCIVETFWWIWEKSYNTFWNYV